MIVSLTIDAAEQFPVGFGDKWYAYGDQHSAAKAVAEFRRPNNNFAANLACNPALSAIQLLSKP